MTSEPGHATLLRRCLAGSAVFYVGETYCRRFEQAIKNEARDGRTRWCQSDCCEGLELRHNLKEFCNCSSIGCSGASAATRRCALITAQCGRHPRGYQGLGQQRAGVEGEREWVHTCRQAIRTVRGPRCRRLDPARPSQRKHPIPQVLPASITSFYLFTLSTHRTQLSCPGRLGPRWKHGRTPARTRPPHLLHL